MKIISFNVNGVRAALKKGLAQWLEDQNPDIFCMQEIKLAETHLVENTFQKLGFNCYWQPAQKRGYSGVAILSKQKPIEVTYQMGVPKFDDEGRVITALYEGYRLICAYFPSGTTGEIRQALKMGFLEEFNTFIQELISKGEKLIICGDVNICHTEIDIHNPAKNKKNSGFLPEERAWVSSFLKNGFVDTFRHFDTAAHNYTWWSYRAGSRAKNLGWRIDYFFTSTELVSKLKSASIMNDVIMSDHCPIAIELKNTNE